MLFDDARQIGEIARKVGTAVFVVPDEVKVNLPNAIMLEPEDKTVISIEQVREVIGRLGVKQFNDLFIVIRPAEKLCAEAANALLKNLEEPGEKVHFVLITENPAALLATIRSRAAIYFLKVGHNNDICASSTDKELAKKLLVAKGNDLVKLAEEIAKKKSGGARTYALSVVGIAIEMLYKSYYITGKVVFLQKLPKFLRTYDALMQNGHIKLQIVAGLG